MEPVKPGGGSGFLAGNGKWYAIGAVVAVGFILFLRSRGSSGFGSSTGTSSTNAPSTDAQNQLNAIGDSLSGLQSSLAAQGIIGNSSGALGSDTGAIVSNPNAGAQAPATQITGFAAGAYPALLGRPIESQSVADYWSSTGNASQQFIGIAGSSEGLSHAEGMSPTSYVAAEYQAFGLTADAGGQQWWAGQLQKDITQTGSKNAGYQLEQSQFANSAAANPASSNYNQPLPK